MQEVAVRQQAQRFVRAIVWGEHTVIWQLLSARGRQAALSIAVRNGLDRVVATRIQDDLTNPIEKDRFLQQLVGGLRRDLRSVELTELAIGECQVNDNGSATAALLSPSTIPGTPPWPAGQLTLSNTGGLWQVDHLDPRLITP